MAQKNATPTKEQIRHLKNKGLNEHEWVVVKDLTRTMIIRNRFTGTIEMIEKT